MKIHVFNFDQMEYIIWIGRNAKNNWEILDKSEPTDILFHVSESPSSYVILQNKEKLLIKNIQKQVIKRCACLCKSNSNSKTCKNIKINYTMIQNCEKSQNLGSVIMNNSSVCII